ncbi:hypothetical protein [Herbaspirillum seropedicae]|uniref:hypothetical protein n=1 Tax=Herbaspirillum seropedicae TaxID=964 RepID=UPI00059C44D6|nr:hypothetical protein [Herbaspirillum seropedicae]
MADCAQFLTFEPCQAADVADWLALAEKRGRQEGAEGIVSLASRGQCFRLMIAGQTVGAYLLQAMDDEVFILAAAGRADIDMTAAIDKAVCQQAQNFETVAFRTVRPGLMRKTAALGYKREGNIFRKRIRP